MYRISIKKNKVERVFAPSKWEVWQEVDEVGSFDYELIRMLEKCEISAYKIETI